MNKKQAAYERLRNRCGEFLDKLYRGERMMVFGEGNLSARVMLVGRPPGNGRPFSAAPSWAKRASTWTPCCRPCTCPGGRCILPMW